MSVKDSNIAINKVAFNLETRLRVTVAVNRCETVFNLGTLAVELVNRTEAVRAGYFQVGREGLWVCFVSLCKLVHPTVVEDCPRVIFRKWFTTFVDALQVHECCSIVNSVSDFFDALIHSAE